MLPRSLGPVSTHGRMLSSQARANSDQHSSSHGAAVHRTQEQASVGASSCLLRHTACSPWAPDQAPRVARVATLGPSTPPVAMESQGWRTSAMLDVPEAQPRPCVACGAAAAGYRVWLHHTETRLTHKRPYPLCTPRVRIRTVRAPPRDPRAPRHVGRPPASAPAGVTTQNDMIKDTAHTYTKHATLPQEGVARR